MAVRIINHSAKKATSTARLSVCKLKTVLSIIAAQRLRRLMYLHETNDAIQTSQEFIQRNYFKATRTYLTRVDE